MGISTRSRSKPCTDLRAKRKGTGMNLPLSGRVRLGALIAVAVGLAAGGVAYASIPDSSGVIHGCRKTVGGYLRVIDSSVSACNAGETQLNWNQKGATGGRGPTGDKGT